MTLIFKIISLWLKNKGLSSKVQKLTVQVCQLNWDARTEEKFTASISLWTSSWRCIVKLGDCDVRKKVSRGQFACCHVTEWPELCKAYIQTMTFTETHIHIYLNHGSQLYVTAKGHIVIAPSIRLIVRNFLLKTKYLCLHFCLRPSQGAHTSYPSVQQ